VTEILYPVDTESAYVRTFRARVVALPPGAVVLDRTYFYPGGGGQPPDRGALRTEGGTQLAVADVSRSGREVLHRLGRGRDPAARALRTGDEVEGAIDWERRFHHMRLHTAQHLASAVLFTTTGLRTRRATLSGIRATLDLEAPEPSGEARSAWRDDFVTAVAGRRPVTVRHVPIEEYERNPSPRSGLVPLPVGLRSVRVIEIAGCDASPCGGTHLRNTAEIGLVRFEEPSPSAPERVVFTLEEPPGAPSTPPS
jgi:misacylated tRNA(Ala) deacylase